MNTHLHIPENFPILFLKTCGCCLQSTEFVVVDLILFIRFLQSGVLSQHIISRRIVTQIADLILQETLLAERHM